MSIAGMPDPVKTIELTPADFPLVIKVAGSEDILYLGHRVGDERDPEYEGAIVEVFSVMDDGITFGNEFPIG